MPINMSQMVCLPTQNVFGRDIIVTPLASQPTAAPYTARGIYDEDSMDVQGLDGSIISETKVILDIAAEEFPILPIQGDHIDIPADLSGSPAMGPFEIVDSDTDGGGEITLTLRRLVPAKP